VEYQWRFGVSWGLPSFLFLWSCLASYIAYSNYSSDHLPTFGISVLFAFLGFYFCLAMLFNYTVISVRPSVLAITHGPLPWFGGKSVNVHQIHSFYRKVISDEGTRFYKFYCVLADGRKRQFFTRVTVMDPSAASECISRVKTRLDPIRKIETIEE
jgi:hypothetical protein